MYEQKPQSQILPGLLAMANAASQGSTLRGAIGPQEIRAAEAPRDLSGAHGKFAGVVERLQKMLTEVSVLTEQLHGPRPGSEPSATRSGGPGVIGAFHDLADDCHRLLSEIEREVTAIRSALGG